jgi:hypothetical protein
MNTSICINEKISKWVGFNYKLAYGAKALGVRSYGIYYCVAVF